MIELRSDTFTKPSIQMRQAMSQAEVGDDVWGEDPTVNLLQKKCAELTGTEAALFVTSGCMANQLSIKCHTEPGDEIICERDSHIFMYENAGASFISGVQIMPLKGYRGVLDVSEVKSAVRPGWYHFPKTSLICIENTHNRAGGTIYPMDEIKTLSSFARDSKIKFHLDGARIFNASVETGISIREYASYFDSISFCFSKGLGAPVGSVLCGDSDFIRKAHKYRKILGGGMRQVGIIAAGALFALEHNVDRLKDDHKKARYFAEAISKLDFIEIDLGTVQTNIVIFSVKGDSVSFNNYLVSKGIMVSREGNRFRAVFHLDVSFPDTENAVKIFSQYYAT